ncbi:MAG: ABC transporter permease [Lachnospiraceae bacterium]
MQQSFKLAIRSIMSNKMRSFLTMLGIIIGVASVIILVSLVNGYMASVVENFSSMGVNQINIRVTNLSTRELDEEQMYEFYEEHRDLFAQMSPNVSVSATVKHGSDSMTATSVGGYSEEYLDVKGYELESGRNIQYSDIASRQKVCVLGSYVAQEFFGNAKSAVGETIKINGYAYKVIGVVECQDEDNLEEGGTDDLSGSLTAVRSNCQMPVSTAMWLATKDVNDTDQCMELTKHFAGNLQR